MVLRWLILGEVGTDCDNNEEVVVDEDERLGTAVIGTLSVKVASTVTSSWL